MDERLETSALAHIAHLSCLDGNGWLEDGVSVPCPSPAHTWSLQISFDDHSKIARVANIMYISAVSKAMLSVTLMLLAARTTLLDLLQKILTGSTRRDARHSRAPTQLFAATFVQISNQHTATS